MRARSISVASSGEAFLAVWEDKEVLAFRGTEGGDFLEVKSDALQTIAQSIAPRFKKDEWVIPHSVEVPIPVDIFDDLDFLPINPFFIRATFQTRKQQKIVMADLETKHRY